MSEQYLIDCVYGLAEKGCSRGGNVEEALNYVADNGGVPLEIDDPNIYTQKACDQSTPKAMILNPCSPFYRFYESDENIKAALYYYGVLAVGVDASGYEFYGGGIFKSPDYAGQLQVNHAVGLVGYGTDASTGIPFWLIRNSWGSGWGESGYIRIDARSDSNGNILGGIVLSENWYAVMKE